jgi:hypothetical protein
MTTQQKLVLKELSKPIALHEVSSLASRESVAIKVTWNQAPVPEALAQERLAEGC